MEVFPFTVIVTFETEAAQGGLEIVHAKTFVPTVSPVILVVGDKELLMIPLPEISVHAPLPTIGVFAAMVVVGLEIQRV